MGERLTARDREHLEWLTHEVRAHEADLRLFPEDLQAEIALALPRLLAAYDALVAERETLRGAAHDFLAHHALDCGAHSCRYCSAKSPAWEHDSHCLYVRSQHAQERLQKVLRPTPPPEGAAR